jgi:hypothetical protein
MLEAEATFLRLFSGPDRPGGADDDPDDDPVVGPQLAALDDERHDILKRLLAMKPTTLAGARALACLGIGLAERDLDGGFLNTADRDRPLYIAMEWLAGPDHTAWWATDPKVRDFSARPSLAHPGAGPLRLNGEV